MILVSAITCPACFATRSETMPTDACQFFYECASCGTLLRPKPGDCCVFCSYGSVTCPPVQMAQVAGASDGGGCCGTDRAGIAPALPVPAGKRRRLPLIPDRSMVVAPAAATALDGIMAAGRYDARFGGIDADAADLLASVLRLYAERGAAPSLHDLGAATGSPQHQLEQKLAELDHRDLVLWDKDRRALRGAYPFTEAVTGHTVNFARSGRTLNTMCVIDALGAGALCRDDARIRSRCHTCHAPIRVETDQGGMRLAEVTPSGSMVWTGFRQSLRCAADSLCTELVFFCCPEHLAAWRSTGASSAGCVLSVEEGFQVGKALFADRALLGDTASHRLEPSADETAQIVCTLAADAFADRVSWLKELTATSLRGVRREELALHLTYAPDAAPAVRELVRQERSCCGFMQFDVEERADAVRLKISVPAETRGAADALFAPFLP